MTSRLHNLTSSCDKAAQFPLPFAVRSLGGLSAKDHGAGCKLSLTNRRFDTVFVFFTSFSHFAIKRIDPNCRGLCLASLHSAIFSKNHWVRVTTDRHCFPNQAGQFSLQSPRVSKLPVWGAQFQRFVFFSKGSLAF